MVLLLIVVAVVVVTVITVIIIFFKNTFSTIFFTFSFNQTFLFYQFGVSHHRSVLFIFSLLLLRYLSLAYNHRNILLSLLLFILLLIIIVLETYLFCIRIIEIIWTGFQIQIIQNTECYGYFHFF
jgi:hypothetical protein